MFNKLMNTGNASRTAGANEISKCRPVRRSSVIGSIALYFGLTAALPAEPLAVWPELEDGCPVHTYLGNQPRGESSDWSEQAQGVANDGEHWFFTHEKKLFKYDANWYAVNGNDEGKIDSTGFPSKLSDFGLDHFGDPDHWRGYLFVPLEDNKPHFAPFDPDADPLGFVHTPPYAIIAVFRASNLELVDWVDVTETQDNKLGWVAIDPVEQALYASPSTVRADRPLLRYELEFDKIDNDIDEDFLDPDSAEPVDLLEEDESELTGEFSYMQGGVFSPWGDLYLMAGKAGDCPVNTRGGIHLFRRTDDHQAFRLVESSVNRNESASCDPSVTDDSTFVFEYHPGATGLGEEPEGIDWWNRDNIDGSRYSGQLHAILLDNQIDDDTIFLKHYRVDYTCVEADDTDSDGVPDGEEVYFNNTHPLLGDSDQDGLEDNDDNCPSTANPDQKDLDDDGAGDVCDADADGDGQSNADERACGSDPLNAASLAADHDADAVPDCIDPDDDGDGQIDTDEQACGSNPLDADSVSPDFDVDTVPDCVDTDDDNDDVEDISDRCPETRIPDSVIPRSGELKKNRYALLDNDLVFDRYQVGNSESESFTVADTGGCNATQIADAMGLGNSHYEFGITRSVLEAWLASNP